jgi:hypothetical protein
LNRDTYDGTIAEPITQNHYAYANSNPVMFRDPSGRVSMIEIQFSLNVQSSLRTSNQVVFRKIQNRLFKSLGCTIAIEGIEGALTGGRGIYLINKGNQIYVGRSVNILQRVARHVKSVFKIAEDLLGRIKVHSDLGITNKELHAIEELVMRLIEAEADGFDNIGNKRRNYKYLMKTYRERMKSIRKKCKNF